MAEQQEQQESFGAWAIVELMGHRRMAGWVSEQNLFGSVMMRIDVPETPGATEFSQFYGGGSVYCVTPVSEEIARKVAASLGARPVSTYELKALPAGHPDDDYPDREGEW